MSKQKTSVSVCKLINNNKAVNTTTFKEKIICFSINNTSRYNPLGALHTGRDGGWRSAFLISTKQIGHLKYADICRTVNSRLATNSSTINQSRNLRTQTLKPPSWSHMRRHNVNLFLLVLSSCRSPVVWPRHAPPGHGTIYEFCGLTLACPTGARNNIWVLVSVFSCHLQQTFRL
jgi:hypothetical protein